MCEFCKPIIECPVGQKRTVVLAEFDNIQTDRKMRTSMVGDKVSEKEIETFIHTEYVDSETWQNLPVHNIQFCPMCGAKLAEKGGGSDE